MMKNDCLNEFMIYKEIIYAVDIHRKAMKLVFTNSYIKLLIYQRNIEEFFFLKQTYTFIHTYMYTGNTRQKHKCCSVLYDDG